jgi:hypothetical protein
MSRWKGLLTFLTVAAAVFYLIFRVVLPSVPLTTHGFIGYYAASRLLLEDGWGPQVYNNEWFIAYTQTFTHGKVGEVIRPNFPTVALLALPVAFLPTDAARAIWLWGNLGTLIAGAILLQANQFSFQRSSDIKKTAPESHSFTILLTAFLFVIPPLTRNFELGQAYIVILFLLAMAVYGLERQNDVLAGISLGLAFGLKSAGVLLWLGLIAQRRWRALAWGVGIFACLALFSLPWIGSDTWAAYPATVINTPEEPILTATAYQSVPGLFSHLFQYHELWSPAPIINFPGLGQLAVGLTGLTALWLTLHKASNAPISLLTAALIALNTVLVPLVEEHQYILMLIPIIILAKHMKKYPAKFQWEWPVFALSILLLSFPVYYKNPALFGGWLSLLAYPRLFAGCGIWLLIVLRLNSIECQKPLLQPG